MSRLAAIDFLLQANNDPSLLIKLQQYANPAEGLLEMAREAGFLGTLLDLRNAAQDLTRGSSALSDKQLEVVSAGSFAQSPILAALLNQS